MTSPRSVCRLCDGQAIYITPAGAMCTNHAFEAAIGEAETGPGQMSIQSSADAPQEAEPPFGGNRLVHNCERWEFPDRSSQR